MNRKESYANHTAGVATAVAFALAGAALHPQQAAAQSAALATDTQSDQLQEVVITAEKRSEDLQKVAISATVLSGDELAQKGVSTLQDLGNVTPGLSIQPQTTGESFINIRGVGVQATSPTSSNGVVFYVDSQYIPDNFTNLFSLFDIGSVQVLRGPQGTLVGVNATGGAILVNTAQPELNSTSGYYTQTIGNYSDFKEEAALNLPISDTLAARAAVVSETEDSFTKNLGSGVTGTFNLENPGNLNTKAVRLQLLWQPTADFQTTLRLEKFQSLTDGPAVKPLADPATDPFSASIQNEPYVVAYSHATFFNIYGERGSAEIKWDLAPGVQLRSVTSVQDGHESDEEDQDFGRDVANVSLQRRTDVQTVTQEVNLLSTGSGPLQWVVGVYYLDTSTPLELAFTSQPAGVPAPIGFFVSPYGVAKHFSRAAFGQVTYNFTPSWSVTLGGRYTEDSLPYNALSFLGPNTVVTSADPTSDKPTGKAAINWNVTEDSLLYVSLANGYKAGGQNLVGAAYGDETNVVTEFGVKSTILDHHLRVDADVFNSNYQHIQLQQFIGGAPVTSNAAGAKFDGGELELTGLFGDFRLDANAAYLHGYFTGAFVYSTNPLPTLAGSPTPYSPTWQGTLGAQYDFHLGSGKLTPRVQWSYEGSETTIPEYAAQTLPVYNVLQAHGIVDANLTYKAAQHWTAAAYVLNATNKVYVANTVDIGLGSNGLMYNAPRQFGVRVNYSFGSSAK
jgi:iron complex outermembrane receptor protein